MGREVEVPVDDNNRDNAFATRHITMELGSRNGALLQLISLNDTVCLVPFKSNYE